MYYIRYVRNINLEKPLASYCTDQNHLKINQKTQAENLYDLIKPIMQLTQLASFIALYVLGYVPHMIQENQEMTKDMC